MEQKVKKNPELKSQGRGANDILVQELNDVYYKIEFGTTT